MKGLTIVIAVIIIVAENAKANSKYDVNDSLKSAK